MQFLQTILFSFFVWQRSYKTMTMDEMICVYKNLSMRNKFK